MLKLFFHILGFVVPILEHLQYQNMHGYCLVYLMWYLHISHEAVKLDISSLELSMRHEKTFHPSMFHVEGESSMVPSPKALLVELRVTCWVMDSNIIDC